MHLDIVDTLRVAVAGDVATAFDDEAAFTMSVGLMSEDSAKKTSSDNDIIVLFHDCSFKFQVKVKVSVIVSVIVAEGACRRRAISVFFCFFCFFL